MVVYREYCDSSGTFLPEKIFNDILELKKYIVEDNTYIFAGYGEKPTINISDIIIDESCTHYDGRVGWIEAISVCIKKSINKDYIKENGFPKCIGICMIKPDETAS